MTDTYTLQYVSKGDKSQQGARMRLMPQCRVAAVDHLGTIALPSRT
jgi:hypothetical protein